MSDLKELKKLIDELEAKMAQASSIDVNDAERLKSLLEATVDIEKERLDLKKKQQFFSTEDFKIELKLKEAIKNRLMTSKVFLDNQNKLKKLQKEEEELRKKLSSSLAIEKGFWEDKLKSNQKNYATLKDTNDMIGKTVPLLTMGGGAMTKLLDGFGMVGSLIGGVINLLKSPFEYFEKIDKAARTISVDVGMTATQMQILRGEASKAATNVQAMGVHIAEILAGQKVYNDELGRTVILTEKQLKDMADIALGTDLGADGAARMASSFEAFGYNMTDVKDLVETTFITNQKLGLNSSKVLKNIEGSLKTAQKYSFKDGAKNLAQMAQTATSVKMSMESVFGLSEKLFELEGAVELSAQLQVLGGSFAALGDPMKLIYQARNDMEGLQKSLIEATKGVAMFDKATGEFKIPSMELHRLRKVAEATGLSIDEMTQSALALSRQDMALSQLRKGLTFSKEQQESVKNLAQLNKGTGKFEINLGDKMVLLENLDPKGLDSLLNKQNTLAQAAAQRLTFFNKISNLFEIFKSGLAPVFDKIMKVLDDSKFADKLTGAMTTISNTIGNMVEGGGLTKFLDSLTEGIKSVGEWIGRLFDPSKNTTIMDSLNSLGRMLGGVLSIAWNNSVGRLGSLASIKNSRGDKIMSFDDLEQVNDGDINPNGLVISKPTPMGLKPIAQGHPNDTAYLRKNGMGGGVTDVNINGTLKLDLGMGVSLDMRRDLINNPEFRYSILQLVSNNMTELSNGTA